MTSSILIKSWRQDRFFLDYLLRSLSKFATGFREIVVLLPEGDRLHFEGTNFYTADVKWVEESDGKNYLRQQIFKLHADKYCAGDYIFVVDSDCFFYAIISPEMFMPSGKPISLLRHWNDASTAKVWKPFTEKFLTFEPMFEGMAALPFIIDRRVLPMIRDYSASTHGCPIEEYILRQVGNDFSEFNALSAWSHRFVPYLYDWRIADPAADGFPRRHYQKWSWDKSGVQPFVEQYEAILAAPVAPANGKCRHPQPATA